MCVLLCYVHRIGQATSSASSDPLDSYTYSCPCTLSSHIHAPEVNIQRLLPECTSIAGLVTSPLRIEGCCICAERAMRVVQEGANRSKINLQPAAVSAFAQTLAQRIECRHDRKQESRHTARETASPNRTNHQWRSTAGLTETHVANEAGVYSEVEADGWPYCPCGVNLPMKRSPPEYVVRNFPSPVW